MITDHKHPSALSTLKRLGNMQILFVISVCDSLCRVAMRGLGRGHAQFPGASTGQIRTDPLPLLSACDCVLQVVLPLLPIHLGQFIHGEQPQVLHCFSIDLGPPIQNGGVSVGLGSVVVKHSCVGADGGHRAHRVYAGGNRRHGSPEREGEIENE